MRLQSPALFYLKGLCCHPDAYSNEHIKELLDDERLDYLSDSYIDKVRASMKPPDPFYPTDKRHAPSLAFILGEGIHRLFLPDESIRMAKKVLKSPRAKEFVESMILVRVPLSVIAAYVTEHRGVQCTGEALRVYQHYFWNIDLLDSTEMRVLVALRIEQAAERIPELKDKKKLLTSAYYKDPRKVASDLPYSPTTAMLAQLRLGIRPGKTDVAVRMMEARDLAVVRAVEAIQQDGPADSMKCLNYINSSRMLEEMLQLIAKPEDQMQDQLRAIALRTETRALPSIHQLSAGKHTVDLAPLEDNNDTSKALVAGEGGVGSDGGAEG